MFSKHFLVKTCLLVLICIIASAHCDENQVTNRDSTRSFKRLKLELIHGEEHVIINIGDWLVLEGESNNEVLARGELITVTGHDSSSIVSLRLEDENAPTSINVQDIEAIWIGPARETWKKIKQSSLVGLVVGTAVGVAMVVPERDWGWMSLTIPASIGVAVPVFGLGGAWYGNFLQYNRATRYLLADERSGSVGDPWEQVDKSWELVILKP